MHNEHGWKEVTDDGEKREVRAVKFGGKWSVQSRLKGDERWTYHDPIPFADLVTLHDVLFRKYQRRRAAVEDVDLIARMIEERQAEGESVP